MRIAINGFGRIGRLLFRQMFGNKNIDIVAINDLTDPKTLAHLLKYDSVQGRYCKTHNIKTDDSSIIVDKKKINIYSERDAIILPWKNLNIDLVVECTGFYASKSKSQAHIDAGAKKVLISAPAGNNLPTVVYNVNHNIIEAKDKIISSASCTTNCLAPMAKNLHELANIEKGFMTTIHAYTGDQNTLDAPHFKGDLRRARAAAVNIIPNSTGAAKAIGLVIPDLAGKLDGTAQRVPVATGSLTELVAVTSKKTTAKQVNAAMKYASNESFGYTEEELVSSDIIGINEGSLFDATQTKVTDLGNKSLVKVVSWYDNEMSYTNQLVRVVTLMGTL